MDIDETILESFKRGEKQSKERGVIGAYWLEYFKFTNNPFFEETLVDDSLEKTFVNRKEIIDELGEYIGGSKYAKNFYHIAIIGARGSGKSAILQILNRYARKHYDTILYSIRDARVVSSSREISTEDPIKHRKYDCVLFDDCYSLSRLRMRINQRKSHPGVLITSIDPISAMVIDIDRKILLHRMNDDEIITMLKKRIELVGNTAVLPVDYYSTVANISLGNPLLALRTAKAIAEDIFNYRYDKEKLNSVLQQRLDTFKNAKEMLFSEWDALTTKERKIIEVLLTSGEPSSITPNELKDHITGGRTLAWKYLERLTEKQILKKIYRGKSSIYELDASTGIILETLCMEELL